MPLNETNTRYSLVKGERIVRYVFNSWLREITLRSISILYYDPRSVHALIQSMWTSVTQVNLVMI